MADQIVTTTLATIANQLVLATENSKDSNSGDDSNSIFKTDVDIGDEISRFSRSQLTFAAVLTIIIMIVGIFGNILTTVALLKCPKVRNVAAAFIISLCIADCIFCAAVLPFNAFRFIEGTWTHGDFLCKLIPFIQYGNIGVSLLCIAMITINRYIMIAHHTSYAKIYKRHWIGAMIVFCWVFSYGMQLPTLLSVWGKFGYDEKLGTCSILQDRFGRSSKTALFAIAFVTPCIIIVACYAKIFWVVHESEVRMRKHAHKQNSIPNNMRQMPSSTTINRAGTSSAAVRASQVSSSSFENTSGGAGGGNGTGTENKQKALRIKDHRDARAKRNEWRITKMVLAIFLSFVACYLPITIVKVLDRDVHWPGFHIFGYIMLYLSACINPIIYVIMNKQYRQAYKTVLTCKPTRLLPFNGGSSNGEKWKDIGFKFDNHSRTMVSQVSLADPNSISSISHSNQLQQHQQNPTSNTVELIHTNLKSQQHYNNNNHIHPINTSLNNTTVTNPNKMDQTQFQSQNSILSNRNGESNQIGQLHYTNIRQNNRLNWLMNTRTPENNNYTIENMNNISHNSQQPLTDTIINHPLQSNVLNNNNLTTNNQTEIPIYSPINKPKISQQQQQQQQQKISAQLEIPPQKPIITTSTENVLEPQQRQYQQPQSEIQAIVTNLPLQRQQYIPRHAIQRPGIRITLDEGDVIIEEDESAAISQISSTVEPTSMKMTTISPNEKTSKQLLTNNLNDIPDNNNKIIKEANNDNKIKNDNKQNTDENLIPLETQNRNFQNRIYENDSVRF
ncbi:uncharacterized protein LOC129617723 [Condylostylus longicornis]|uniref:uncharacterized protein LOC129617723 n=1 Tax=Condylostylus longicornis TaxID=2530218 RepID=UPI00244DBD11|nr:uncharacterized protein LOC129617723 [Condylostylus longicornis]